VKPPIGRPVAQTPLSWRRLFRWSRQSIAGIEGRFYLFTLIALFTNLITLYNAQLITNFSGQAHSAITSQEGDSEKSAGSAGSTESLQGGFGFVDAIMPDDVATTAILFAITAIASILLAYANRVGTVWINTLMLQRLQLRLHDKLLLLGPTYHGQHDVGENQTVIMNYAQQAQGAMRDVLASPIVRSVSLITAIMLLFYNLSKLSGQEGIVYLIVAVLLIVLPVGGWWLAGRIRAANVLLQQQQGMVANTLVDSLSTPQEVQLMNAGARRSATFAARLRTQAEAQLRSNFQSELANQFPNAVPTLLQIGLILWAVFVVGGSAAVQAAVAIYLFVPRVVAPIQEFITFYTTVSNAWPSIERVGLLLEEPLEVRDTGTKTASDLSSYDVSLTNVTYQPVPDRTVLNDVSFRFPSGKIIALVGLSGSGKSTILKVISRLFDPNAGSVTIGNVNIKDLKLEALRSVMASVSQFPLFIESDVRENMRLAAPKATDEQMEAACRAADIWSALVRISPTDPLSAPVPRMAGKAGLSGGERRRLAIARTLLADPRILLLDEPAAGIDVLSVNRIADELKRVAPGRTTLLVEHNIPLISSVADIVCCIEEGRITDVGSPAELSKRPTLFKTLMDTQLAYGDQVEYDVDATVPVPPIEVQAAQTGATKGGRPAGGVARAAQAGAPKGSPGAQKGMKQPA
jgi:ABC-type multidrug transport system fused ATPase/permease subunit